MPDATQILPRPADLDSEDFEPTAEDWAEMAHWAEAIRRNERIEHEDSEQHGTWGGHADEWEVIDR